GSNTHIYAKARQVVQRARFTAARHEPLRSAPDGESNWPAICIVCLALGVSAFPAEVGGGSRQEGASNESCSAFVSQDLCTLCGMRAVVEQETRWKTGWTPAAHAHADRLPTPQ